MTRIETENKKDGIVDDLQSEINKLKKGLKKKQNRRILGCGSCIIAFFIFAILLSSFVSYFLAKSGIVQIPYLSDFLYKEPKPVYIVETIYYEESQKDPLLMLKDNLLGSFETINNALNSKVDLQFSDSKLTSLISEQVRQNKSLNNRIDFLQIAVLPQNLELFIKLKNPQNTYLIFEIIPKAQNNKIELEVISFKIGNLKMPNFIGKVIIAPIGEKVLNMIIAPFLGFGKIQDMGLDYGRIYVKVLITSLQGLF
ncbi:hypothetical protein JW977_04655 [Candidatus Falkowbacteria bacterium]|nr:hypothetical protein [Candidatus Falkowbacteria bacterium]